MGRVVLGSCQNLRAARLAAMAVVVAKPWEGAMAKKKFTGQVLLNGVNEEPSHSEELVAPLPQGVHPEGSVNGCSRRLSGSWDEYFDSEGCSDDFLENRNQPAKQRD